MPALFPFQPAPRSGPFQFTPTLDGTQYNAVVTWNVYGQRWYVSIYDLSGNLVVARPVVPTGDPQPLAPPVMTEMIASMAWAPANGGTVSVVMAAPTIYNLGNTIEIQGATNSGTAGDAAVNGAFVVDTFTDPTHFTFLLTAPAGAIGTIGGSPEIVVPTAALSWSNETGQGLVTASTAAPHGFDLGAPVLLEIAGEVPAGYNGLHLCDVRGPSTFTYPLATDPGQEAVVGTYCSQINLAAPWFTTSRMIFRESQSRFEVTP